MSKLVEKLCRGDHPIELRVRAEQKGPALKECIERGYVHVKFTDTLGGTELGVPLDRTETKLEAMDIASLSGHAVLVGRLTLDGVNVKCTARVDISTLSGIGHLEVLSG